LAKSGRRYSADNIAIEFSEIKQNKGYYAIQGHRCRYQSIDHMQLPISD